MRRRRRGGLLAAAGIVAVAGAGLAVWLGGLSSGGAPPGPTSATATVPETLRIIFPEGFTRRDMAERVGVVREIAVRTRGVRPRLTAQAYLAATAAAKAPPQFRRFVRRRSIEGFLFPATYDFTQQTSARTLVAEQLAAFRDEWARLSLRYARSKNLTPYDVLIIASMIEKEAVVPAERPLIAAVIYNRLRARMPLGIDATIRYGLVIPGTESLTRAALESGNAYNTRRFRGLPPTPIANPGLPSMQAAAHPARVDYLYYVRKPDGRHHFFTANAQEFLRKVCQYGFGCR